MSEKEILGKRLLEIYETKHIIEDGFLDSRAAYFDIFIEVEDKGMLELGMHEVKKKTDYPALFPSRGTLWATENKIEYKNQRIQQIILRDPNEYFDGSLTLVLENNVTIEHLGTNGDELCIDRLKDTD